MSRPIESLGVLAILPILRLPKQEINLPAFDHGVSNKLGRFALIAKKQIIIWLPVKQYFYSLGTKNFKKRPSLAQSQIRLFPDLEAPWSHPSFDFLSLGVTRVVIINIMLKPSKLVATVAVVVVAVVLFVQPSSAQENDIDDDPTLDGQSRQGKGEDDTTSNRHWQIMARQDNSSPTTDHQTMRPLMTLSIDPK